MREDLEQLKQRISLLEYFRRRHGCRAAPEAVPGNIKSLLRRGRGYKDLRYLLKGQRMAATKTEFVGKRPKMRVPSNSCGEQEREWRRFPHTRVPAIRVEKITSVIC